LKDITRFIPYGRKNAISKPELCRLSGFHERSIRDIIKKANTRLVKEGFAIISSSRSRGYWITDDPKELKVYLREAERRANKIYEHNYPIYGLVAKLQYRKPQIRKERPYF